MCGKATKAGNIITPGDIVPIYIRGNHYNLTWGINEGHIYNARVENLNTTWHSLNKYRGILELDSFFENNMEFTGLLKVGCIIRPTTCEFAVITQPSNKQVLLYHNRMPYIVYSIEDFLYSNKLQVA